MRSQTIETNEFRWLPYTLTSPTSSTPCASQLRTRKQYEENVRMHLINSEPTKSLCPVSSVDEVEDKDITCTKKREIRVEKIAEQDFGASLLCFDDAIFIAYVEKYATADTYTAAYRAGLKFGDEICSINRVNVSDLCRSVPNGVRVAKSELDYAMILVLEVIDQSAFSQHVIPMSKQSHRMKGGELPEQIGILFAEDGDILDVAEGSVGEKSGLTRGSRIIRIGGQFTVNTSPRSYEKLFRKSQRRNQQVTVTAGNTVLTCGLISEALRHLAELHANYDLLSYNLNVHLENDFSSEPKPASSMSRFWSYLGKAFKRSSISK
ncbi:hypothetical protein SARC_05748 [Sphaeroforma arctica JP610]|uniref:PDZ domain-containing protein n=1 Tax=Sphaeroforma arctica JP610 TaxID=667725 RepID=A0A0L0FYN1_9EUKA|nr:hypothetical protein SARC_05748 [Sphaeroforma arctica JP610]KNC81957.1 hypothetical protein SARC_05748 [Sphaeroforma arctica JP610]|eukprot:XP_014155859.1 hypothetical protein SARC_05748 [Sphaeroforma arctica JP610]